ncbi:hypothetical protein L3X38_039192 [Prunus dulcis]|uniref:Uncharacterized protein n=1 Tax=Prunus dulcis TaxID=3755 RepID=A0AAD4V6K4_PRUDU|nr:hypothetical protein L3X38_039192 [Prunus dulcis]
MPEFLRSCLIVGGDISDFLNFDIRPLRYCNGSFVAIEKHNPLCSLVPLMPDTESSHSIILGALVGLKNKRLEINIQRPLRLPSSCEIASWVGALSITFLQFSLN